MSKLHLDPAFEPAQFLETHWQKQPLLIRGLVPAISDVLDADELAGLACEECVESRLIRETIPGRYSLQHGPFSEDAFLSLPDSHWTLLVQAVDQWLEDVAQLRSLFEFIPRWRIDDVMISYATNAGSVGPHFDYYDVFLIQGSGQRRWQVGDLVPLTTELDVQDGVGILPTFNGNQEFVLNPGDALYLPPRFAHWGQSVGESMCFSIGFRAPSLAEMLEGFSDELIAGCSPAARLLDDRPSIPRQPAEIPLATIEAAFTRMQQSLQAPESFARWFGSFVSQPKYPELRQAPSRELSLAELQQALESGQRLQQAAGSRFAYLPAGKALPLLLFVDGEAITLPEDKSEEVLQLCDPTSLHTMTFDKMSSRNPLHAAVLQLVNQGSLLLR